MQKKLNILLQYILPKHAISKFAGWLGESETPWLKNFLIKQFAKNFNVDMSACTIENLEEYPTFNSFFTRKLKAEARPIASGEKQIASPVDGFVSQIGKLKQDILLQAKGFYFDLISLIGCNEEKAQPFYNGNFATFYLSPKDYHCIHMPVDGKLVDTLYVPGRLFSVNQTSAEMVPQLFSRNERLICFFETAHGPMIMVLIGAIIVGSISCVFKGEPVILKKGEELGFFKLGSTVILLFPNNTMQWDESLQAGSIVKMGQQIGDLTTPQQT